ncbi:MAG: histidine kinase [Rhodocyclales bacterium GWA2_65_20]|nr:MAG: histidine kinase [Rhodocyclales bacterium GWA2_65_20]
MDTREDPVAGNPQTAARLSFERLSFSRQFLLGSAVVVLVGMAVVGTWLSSEIERSTVNRAAAVAAVYVESILAAQLRPEPGMGLDVSETHALLDRIFVDGPLRRKVVRFKLWDRDGVIRYSSDHGQLGRRFPVDGLLAAAFAGTVQARISDLDEADNPAEREHWQQLLEVLVPVRVGNGSEVGAVAEFYHSTENLARDIASAQQRSWWLVAVTTFAIFLLLRGLVRRADDTILVQQNDLRRQLHDLRAALDENERMRGQLGEAGARTTALNEQFLHRVAADLHDGPAQALAFALMRFDESADACAGCERLQGEAARDMEKVNIRRALRSSLEDVRNIAAGLGLPGITELSLADTARRAVRDFERQAALPVPTEIDGSLIDAPLAIKITVYRLIQESLTNSRRHAPGGTPQVRLQRENGQVRVEIADQGAGFDPAAAARSGRLGLAFMHERIRLLGGTFAVDSAPGRGTCIRAHLPLSAIEVPHV